MRLEYVSVRPNEIASLRDDPDLAPSLLTGNLAGMIANLPPDAIAAMQRQLQAVQQQMRAAGFEMPRIPGFPGLPGAPASGSRPGAPHLRLVRPEDFEDDEDDAHDGGNGGDRAARGAAGGNGDGRADGGRVRGELEKAWHGLHFVFTGRADEAPPPRGYLLSGGTEVGEDLGYGPARLLTPAETRAFRDTLAAMSDADFDRRFDLVALQRHRIYPECWDEDRDELLEEYGVYFQQLKTDLDRIAAAGDGLLIGLM